MSSRRSLAIILALPLSLPLLAGCGNPSAANIALRKQLQQRDDTIDQLNRQHVADAADIATHRGPTTTSLSPDVLATIYTVHGLKLGRLTGSANLDSTHPGDDGLKIQATPIDEDGQSLKAAGSFEVTAFDLNDGGRQIGHWVFDQAAARADWFGSTLLYSYVLPCPWQQVPTHADVTVCVTFTDTLTGREFSEQKQIHLPPSLATSRP